LDYILFTFKTKCIFSIFDVYCKVFEAMMAPGGQPDYSKCCWSGICKMWYSKTATGIGGSKYVIIILVFVHGIMWLVSDIKLMYLGPWRSNCTGIKLMILMLKGHLLSTYLSVSSCQMSFECKIGICADLKINFMVLWLTTLCSDVVSPHNPEDQNMSLLNNF